MSQLMLPASRIIEVLEAEFEMKVPAESGFGEGSTSGWKSPTFFCILCKQQWNLCGAFCNDTNPVHQGVTLVSQSGFKESIH